MFDLLIKNGTVIDGSGSEGFRADVAVKDGKIAAIGENLGEAAQVIDATGLTVTPGFIDSHSHAESAVLTSPEQIEKVEQGITTNIGAVSSNSANFGPRQKLSPKVPTLPPLWVTAPSAKRSWAWKTGLPPQKSWR